jgi:hypothetical protein
MGHTRVFLVEDEALIRLMLVEIIEGLGHRRKRMHMIK